MTVLFTGARRLIPAFLAMLLASFAIGCDGLGASAPDSAPRDSAPAPKTFEEGIPREASFTDKGGATWTIAFDETTFGGQDTDFSYTVSTSGAPSTGSFLALELPACATFVSSSPPGTMNANANGTLEWHFNDLAWVDGEAPVTYTFAGDVQIGLVRVSFKSGGTGSAVETKVIAGPCQGRYPVSGHVLLDDHDGTMYGIAGVVVTLREDSDGDGLVDTPNARNDGSVDDSRTTDADGRYAFDVWGPPFHSGIYEVSIGSEGANAVLHDTRLFTALTPLSVVTDVKTSSAVDFKFEVNVAGALDAFDQGTVASDGQPRPYWRVQATGKGSPKYQPEISFAEFEALLDGFSDAFDVSFAFGPDRISRIEAAGILQTASNGDVLEALRTGILVLGLNYASGRGMCTGTNVIDGRCETWDEPATRLILEHAIGTLRNTGYQVAAKAPSGSTETTTRLVSEVNNDG